MSFSDERRKNQLSFICSESELEVGSLEGFPLSAKELQQIDETSDYVVKVFNSGLTAQVYKLKINHKFYNLKKKRDKILVQNIDGQTSFLNEVQRRQDFHHLKLKNSEGFSGIVDTLYASFKKGIILSPWIEGKHIVEWNYKKYESLFSTLLNMEFNGIFEWDLCSGNLLYIGNHIMLFDFGYAYPFDVLTQFNSDGLENPLFHMVERFESRFFMQYLMELESETNKETMINAYKEEKEVALTIYKKKLEYIKKNNGSQNVIEWLLKIILSWEEGVSSISKLEELYKREAFRSYVLDIGDDVGGQSCTKSTIKKVNRVLKLIEEDYQFLKNSGGLFFGDEKLDKFQLTEKYKVIYELVIKYQLS
ncbi:MAG: hypothetical protein Q8936_04275 [Bacillota bacterium]|nr:hypothetical protein [Bacillota bacterium]